MSAIEVIATLRSTTPYSQSKYVQAEKLPKEASDDYDARTWRERMHCDDDGDVYIPPMAFKNCLSDAAKYLSIQIPGKGKSTYTKHFEAGVLCVDPLMLGIKRDDVPMEALHVPSDGRRGGTTRVVRRFPKIARWSGDVRFLVLDRTITQDVFRHVLEEAGSLIGIGRFRPRNNGYYGRFAVDALDWRDSG
jgi:hypothetical protein